MAFKSASRFNYSITLPFGEGRSYRVASPPVEVGNFMVESTQLNATRAALVLELTSIVGDYPEGDELQDADAARVAEIEAQLEELTARLTVPDEMVEDYFRSVLGDAYDAMTEAREPFELVKLAASTVSVWVLSGLEEAERFWNEGGRVNPQKAPQDRRRKASKSSPRGSKRATSK